jgi:hypothetical protein
LLTDDESFHALKMYVNEYTQDFTTRRGSHIFLTYGEDTGKVYPVTLHEGTEGKIEVLIYPFMAWAVDGGGFTTGLKVKVLTCVVWVT